MAAYTLTIQLLGYDKKWVRVQHALSRQGVNRADFERSW